MNTVWILIWVGYTGVGGNSSAALTAHRTETQCNAVADVMAKAYADRFLNYDERTKVSYRKGLVCVEAVK